jgi:cysteine desulfurase
MNVYLDNNATTPLAPEVLDAMLPSLRDQYERFFRVFPGAGGKKALEGSRETIARIRASTR